MYHASAHHDVYAAYTVGNTALSRETWDDSWNTEEPSTRYSHRGSLSNRSEKEVLPTGDDRLEMDRGYMADAIDDCIDSLRCGTISGNPIMLTVKERMFSYAMCAILSVLAVAYVLAINIM